MPPSNSEAYQAAFHEEVPQRGGEGGTLNGDVQPARVCLACVARRFKESERANTSYEGA